MSIEVKKGVEPRDCLTLGGRFAMSTMRVCSTALEKRGPTGVQSVHVNYPILGENCSFQLTQ